MPTLLEYLGLPLPDGANLPGQSFNALLRGAERVGRESLVVHDEYGPTRMLRTHRWKYVHRYPDGPNELYDLGNDPGEFTNLAEEPTEVSRMLQMREQLEVWFRTYATSEMDGKSQPISGRGQLARLRSNSRPKFSS